MRKRGPTQVESATTPDLVRWVTYEEAVTGKCLEEEGFTVEWASDGLSYTVSGLGAQETSTCQADYECLAMYSPDPDLTSSHRSDSGSNGTTTSGSSAVSPSRASRNASPLLSREVHVGTQGKWDGYPFGHPGIVTCRPSPPSLALLGIP